MAETFMRQWAMLRRIPREPRLIDTSSLKSMLESEGYKADMRTIQRDLNTLSKLFPLRSDERSKPFGWTWTGKDVFDVPGMDPQTALAFDMTAQYMQRMLPASTMKYLSPYIKQAHGVLDQLSESSEIRQWTSKLKVLPQGMKMIPPEIKPEVADVIYESLLVDKRVQVTYQKRNGEVKEYLLNPLGLIVRNNVTYLITSIKDYESAMQFAMHRFLKAELLDTERTTPEGFDLDSYIAGGNLGYTVSDKKLHVKLWFDDYSAQHIIESPLSDDQQYTVEEDGSVVFTATVLDDLELRWWLQGYGANVEVLEPANLRQEFVNLAKDMASMYLDAT